MSPNHDIGHHDLKNSKNHHNRHNPDPVEVVPFCRMSLVTKMHGPRADASWLQSELCDPID